MVLSGFTGRLDTTLVALIMIVFSSLEVPALEIFLRGPSDPNCCQLLVVGAQNLSLPLPRTGTFSVLLPKCV